MKIKLFRIIPVAVIAAILSFVIYTAYDLPQAKAQSGMAGQISNVFNTDQYEEVLATGSDVLSITTGLISTSEPTTQRAYIKFTGQGARWRCDGSDPSTSNGNPAAAGEWIQLLGLSDVQNFRYVNDDDTGTSTAHVNLQVEGDMVP